MGGAITFDLNVSIRMRGIRIRSNAPCSLRGEIRRPAVGGASAMRRPTRIRGLPTRVAPPGPTVVRRTVYGALSEGTMNPDSKEKPSSS